MQCLIFHLFLKTVVTLLPHTPLYVALEPAARILNIIDNPSAITTCYHKLAQLHERCSNSCQGALISILSIHTLIASSWTQALAQHPNQPLVSFFLEGISKGFRIRFNKPPRGFKSPHKNLSGALKHPQVEEYIIGNSPSCLRFL